MKFLSPCAGGRYLDGTAGLGGHAWALLNRSEPDGWLYLCDRDLEAVEAAKRRLQEFTGRYEIRHSTFDQLDGWITPETLDGALLDLGVSSMQLDNGQRGFSFSQDAPIDMRMDATQPLTAGNLINEAPVEELMRLFWDYGDEPKARRIARAIGEARERAGIVSTVVLAGIVERAVGGRKAKTHPATRVFQALRIAVNEEYQILHRGLEAVFTRLKVGGVLAIISFHSGEDRIVKNFCRRKSRAYEVVGEVDRPEFRRERDPLARVLTKKPIEAASSEVADNPRSRSAKLRVLTKLQVS